MTNLAKNLIRELFKNSTTQYPKSYAISFQRVQHSADGIQSPFYSQSLKNPTNNPRKLPQIDQRRSGERSCAVLHDSFDGPCFGYKGLRIRNNANINTNSYEYLGYIYTVPSGKRGDPFLTGGRYFTASEKETFYETIQ